MFKNKSEAVQLSAALGGGGGGGRGGRGGGGGGGGGGGRKREKLKFEILTAYRPQAPMQVKIKFKISTYTH